MADTDTPAVDDKVIDFFLHQTTDITTPSIFVQISECAIFVSGVFGGAQAKLQVSPDNTEWFDHEDATFIDKEWINASLGEVYIRAVLSGSTGTTDVSFWLRPRIATVANI